jgi:hypothetical protein
MASSKGSTRPLTSVDAKHFIGGNTKTNLTNLQDFIRNSEFRKNQIVSITSHESHIAVEDGMDPENEVVLFYRKDSINPGEAPLDNIQFSSGNPSHSWARQEEVANSFRFQDRPVDTIAVVRTPKAVGNARIQSLWYTSEQTLSENFSKLINRADGDWDGLANNVKEFLNDFIAPHQLISITLFEESHPNQSGMIGALVTHTGGAVPTRLSQTAAARSLPTAGIYKLDCLRGEQTSILTKQALTVMNTRGGQEGYAVATTNDAVRDDLFGMVISW